MKCNSFTSFPSHWFFNCTVATKIQSKLAPLSEVIFSSFFAQFSFWLILNIFLFALQLPSIHVFFFFHKRFTHSYKNRTELAVETLNRWIVQNFCSEWKKYRNRFTHWNYKTYLFHFCGSYQDTIKIGNSF